MDRSDHHIVKISITPDNRISISSDFQITRFPDHQISRSSDMLIIRYPDHHVIRSSDSHGRRSPYCQIIKIQDRQIIRSRSNKSQMSRSTDRVRDRSGPREGGTCRCSRMSHESCMLAGKQIVNRPGEAAANRREIQHVGAELPIVQKPHERRFCLPPQTAPARHTIVKHG